MSIFRPIMSVVEAAFVGVVLVMMLSLLFVGWKTPEVVVGDPTNTFYDFDLFPFRVMG